MERVKELRHQIRLDIADVMRTAGLTSNPWSTGIRDLGIDAGAIGSVAIIGLLGYTSQKLYNRSRVAHSYVAHVTATYTSVACFIFAFISPFQIRILSNGFVLLAAIAFARYIAILATRQRATNPPNIQQAA